MNRSSILMLAILIGLILLIAVGSAYVRATSGAYQPQEDACVLAHPDVADPVAYCRAYLRAHPSP